MLKIFSKPQKYALLFSTPIEKTTSKQIKQLNSKNFKKQRAAIIKLLDNLINIPSEHKHMVLEIISKIIVNKLAQQSDYNLKPIKLEKDAMYLLATCLRQQSSLADYVLRNNIIVPLLTILSNGNKREKINASGIINLLSTYSSHSSISYFKNLDLFSSMTQRLYENSTKIQVNIFLTYENLLNKYGSDFFMSNETNSKYSMKHQLPISQLIRQLDNSSSRLCNISTRIMTKMSDSNYSIEILLINQGVVGKLIKLLDNNSPHISANAALSLANLTAKHPKAALQILKCDGVKLLINKLISDDNYCFRLHTATAIKNIINSTPEITDLLYNEGVLERLKKLRIKEPKISKQIADSTFNIYP